MMEAVRLFQTSIQGSYRVLKVWKSLGKIRRAFPVLEKSLKTGFVMQGLGKCWDFLRIH